MAYENVQKEIEQIAMRQAWNFYNENRHLDDDTIGAGLFFAVERAKLDYKKHPALAELIDRIMILVCAEVWRLRDEAKERNV